MARRVTWLGRLFQQDRMAARAELVRILRRYRGNVKRAAIDIGYARRHIFRLLWREGLWHELDVIRAEACRHEDGAQPMSFLERASHALRAPTMEEAMAYRTNNVGLLVRLEPQKAANLIAQAYRETNSEREAAIRLGCGRSSLRRWVRVLVAGGYMDRPVFRRSGFKVRAA